MAGAMMLTRINKPSDFTMKKVETEHDRIMQREQLILTQGELLKKEGKAKKLTALIKETRLFLAEISKAKAAKLVRSLSLESRLMALYFESGMFSEALQHGAVLLKELKKLDDKNVLVDVLLLESKAYHALNNLSKARASFTSDRTTANSIYCPPKMQYSLDLQSGILSAADEQDFKTAYSYFHEAFEGFDSVDSTSNVLKALKYMLLSKIMLNNAEDVQQIVSGKLALKYTGRDVEAMKSIARASHKRSLADFQIALN
ncbi:hypothetical protein QTP88_023082 [Uroleucon formosanum]